jgi:hypothetical protein
MGILDLLKDIPLSAVLREKIIDIETENKALKAENAILKVKLEESEQQRRALEKQIEQKLLESHNSNPLGYVCDHCGSAKLTRTRSDLDPIFGVVGIKQSIFSCQECGKESAFTQQGKAQ